MSYSLWGHKESDKCVSLSFHLILLQILFHDRLSQDTDYCSLYYTVGLCCLNFLSFLFVCFHYGQDLLYFSSRLAKLLARPFLHYVGQLFQLYLHIRKQNPVVFSWRLDIEKDRLAITYMENYM